MLKKITDFILLSMGITPKGAEPAEDKWAEARRRAGASEQSGQRETAPAVGDTTPHEPDH